MCLENSPTSSLVLTPILQARSSLYFSENRGAVRVPFYEQFVALIVSRVQTQAEQFGDLTPAPQGLAHCVFSGKETHRGTCYPLCPLTDDSVGLRVLLCASATVATNWVGLSDKQLPRLRGLKQLGFTHFLRTLRASPSWPGPRLRPQLLPGKVSAPLSWSGRERARRSLTQSFCWSRRVATTNTSLATASHVAVRSVKREKRWHPPVRSRVCEQP